MKRSLRTVRILKNRCHDITASTFLLTYFAAKVIHISSAWPEPNLDSAMAFELQRSGERTVLPLFLPPTYRIGNSQRQWLV